ncbi:MAG: Lrp/AsnC family transcriptional regulator [Candidatus Thorarchaeota archaeon]
MDEKDLQIVTALDKYGAKVSTEELSSILGIPARTVRYRLSRLRKNKILYSRTVITHERKMGLGENILIMKATQRGSRVLPKMFEAITPLYWFSPTYGTYNGFYVHCLYSLATPLTARRFLEEFQKEGLITDFFLFDITDYEVTVANYEKYVPGKGWDWDWKEWADSVERNIRKRKKPKTKLEDSHSLVDFDASDVDILLHLLKNGMITQKKLAQETHMSEAQVNKRVRRLEKEGIIKGYRSGVWTQDITVDIVMFFELDENAEGVITSFYELPFPTTMIMESKSRYGIRLGLQATDWDGFLTGVDRMQPYLKWFCFQTIHHRQQSMEIHPFMMFDAKTHRWETQSSNYLQTIRDVLAQEK